MADIADQVIEGATSSATKADLPVARAAARESLMRQDPEGYAQTCEALANATAADLSGVACPTLLIAGEDDAVAPQAMARAIADRVRGARVVVLPRCGHWLTFERAADVNREMKDFFSRQP
jgi:pimeloyl-ACP methyl ester carboxylesterase